MPSRKQTRRAVRWVGMAMLGVTGCNHAPTVPQGYLPRQGYQPDDRTAAVLMLEPARPTPMPIPKSAEEPPAKDKGIKPFELPQGLPGAGTPIAKPPRFTKDTPLAER